MRLFFFIKKNILQACGIVVVVAFASLNGGCSNLFCRHRPVPDLEAGDAIVAFFNSQSDASKKLIAQLQKDGMEDDFLLDLKTRCNRCYVFRGKTKYDNDSWYAVTPIAPEEKKRFIVLRVDCSDTVVLDHTLYGG